jgi:hypothetical protein
LAIAEARRARTGAGAEKSMGNRRQVASELSKTRTWQKCSVAVGSAVASTVNGYATTRRRVDEF